MQKTRYVLVGTGGRSTTYLDALTGACKASASLEAVCDLSQVRMDWHNLRQRERFGVAAIPTYKAADFDRMIREKQPDVVIVTSIDSTHHQYIIRAMELGCDVISEKPLTTDAEKMRAIFDAIDRTGRSLRVTFNCRYIPFAIKVRELMMQGVVGTPHHIDFSWMLNTSHGADYFRRWHREKDRSGGLQVHKSTHHFDLMNWWIDSYPRTVFAMGDLKFYGKENAERRGHKYSYERYTGAPEADGDPFCLRLEAVPGEKTSIGSLPGLYLNAEKETGYVRDRNVFGSGITIEDSLCLCVRYRSGAMMSYSLVTYSPWEGLQVAITGDKGRIDLTCKFGSHIIRGQSSEEVRTAMSQDEEYSLRVSPLFGVPYNVEIPKGLGDHGGEDAMLTRLFGDEEAAADPLGLAASHFDGAASLLIGISANEAMRTGLPVNCDDLLKLPEASQQSVGKDRQEAGSHV